MAKVTLILQDDPLTGELTITSEVRFAFADIGYNHNPPSVVWANSLIELVKETPEHKPQQRKEATNDKQ